MVLYDLARNPLAHALAVLDPGQPPVAIVKPTEGLAQDQVDMLELAYSPSWQADPLPPVLIKKGDEWHLNVVVFYADIVELFRSLVADPEQMTRAEACFARGELTD